MHLRGIVTMGSPAGHPGSVKDFVWDSSDQLKKLHCISSSGGPNIFQERNLRVFRIYRIKQALFGSCAIHRVKERRVFPASATTDEQTSAFLQDHLLPAFYLGSKRIISLGTDLSVAGPARRMAGSWIPRRTRPCLEHLHTCFDHCR